jgi:hypothetical protein
MSQVFFFSGASLLFASLIMSGCGDGQDRNTATVKAAAAVTVDVSKARQGLEQVIVSLKNLRDANENADLKKLDGDLKVHSATVTSALADVDASSSDAVTAGTKQTQIWHSQADGFTDPDLRAASSKREGALRTAVDALSSSRMSYLTNSQSFRTQLSQSVSALDLDLSQAGVKSLRTVLSKIVDNEAPVLAVLTDIADKSKTVTDLLRP